MQGRLVHVVVGAAFFLLAVSMGSAFAQGAQLRVETLYPRHAPPGRATVINVAVPSPDAVQGAEVSPSAGVTVAGIKGHGSGSEQNIGWWEITLEVANDAAPGDRSLVLVMRTAGRTAPVALAIPTHGPTISDLRVAPTQTNQPTVDLQLTAADPAGDLGQSPYVWFMADCGGEPIVGAVRGTVNAGSVRATLPHLRRTAADGIPAAGKCDVRVRMTDAGGIDSNTLTTTIEFKE